MARNKDLITRVQKLGTTRYKAKKQTNKQTTPPYLYTKSHCQGVQACNPRTQKVLGEHCFEFQPMLAYRERLTLSQENPNQPIIKH